MKRALCVSATVALFVAPVAAADPRPETLAAWTRYVAQAETRLHHSPARTPSGTLVSIPGGTIYHWRASVMVSGTTVDTVTTRLLYPGTPPPQDDVLESRVLAREGKNALRVYLKLSRSMLVTATYDTEHFVTFERPSQHVATSRSLSTRIQEIGADRGFLWRLNSYWRYTQVGDDVRIELESISLSRDVPRLARPVALPLANRIARESVARTMASVQAFLE